MALASPIKRWQVFEADVPRTQLWTQLGTFGLCSAVTVIAAVLKPAAHGHGTHQQLGLPPCPSALIFSRPCPGCGLTKSWSALIHGDLPFAFHAHALGPLLYLIFTALALGGIYGFASGQRLRTDSHWFNRLTMIFVVGFIAYGAVRFAFTPNFSTPFERQIMSFGR